MKTKNSVFIYYVNGKFIDSNHAFINILDIGLLRGYGVFDFLITYKGKPFLLNEHIKRLFNSASSIGLKIGKSESEIRNIIIQTLQKNLSDTEKSIRIVITGGVGISTTEPGDKPTIIVIIDDKHDYPAEYYKNGIKVITFSYTRALASVKSLDYSMGIKALDKARHKNAQEAIYVDQISKTVSEATTSNVFIIKKGKISTSNENILKGMTRNLVIKLLSQIKPVTEKQVNLKQLLSADEVFITASNKEVIPVTKIDNHNVGDGKVGPTTKKVMHVFRDYIEKGIW
ncbi:MAG TPA: aminotransferase class IV [Patescibacteria group bacterium]|nr:aminotransferase class IV [Patescibacteria group bacterium]